MRAAPAPWPPAETARLLLVLTIGGSLAAFARDHKRSPVAVRLKAMRLRRDPATRPPDFTQSAGTRPSTNCGNTAGIGGPRAVDTVDSQG